MNQSTISDAGTPTIHATTNFISRLQNQTRIAASSGLDKAS
jgi:hypothetical protein